MAEKSWNPAERKVVANPNISIATTLRYNKRVFIWDEKKRQANLAKHGLDFKDAANVYNNPQKLTRRSNRQGEQRYADIAVIQIIDTCLTLIYTERGEDLRIISFRNSSRKERRLLVRSWQPD